MRTALTIAGSDSSGGAGIQADIKTMITNGVYAMSAITALTAQNTTGVTGIMEVTPDFLGEQMDNVFTDIRPDAVKIGMVSSAALIEKIAEKLKEYQAENIVVDPVMVATSGAKLIQEDAIEALKTYLLPMATVLTPNIPEAEILSGMKIEEEEAMIEAAKKIIVQFFVKADISSTMPMTCCIVKVNFTGFTENVLIIQIPTVQDVPYQAPLLRIWRKVTRWRLLWSGQKITFLEPLARCSILAPEAVL